MSTTEQHLKRIQEKLQQLLKQHALLQKENQVLNEELNRNKKQLALHEGNMDKLKQQVEILKLGNSDMHEDDRKLFEKRINSYLKEIDRCITILSD